MRTGSLHFLPELITSFLMNTVRGQKNPSVVLLAAGLMEPLEMDCTKMDWALFSHPFNIQSGWKNTWQPPYFLLPQQCNMSPISVENVLRQPGRYDKLYSYAHESWKHTEVKPAKNLFNKKNLLASMNYKTLSHFSKVRWSHYFNFSSDFQTNFLSWLHCALSNACHTPITIISRLSQR